MSTTQPDSAMPLTVPSPAKVNLFLRVGPRRADGFHTLTSWFCLTGLQDQLSLTPSAGEEVTLSCDAPWVPCDSRNLILRAAEMLKPFATRRKGTHITLRKRIPVGGGLGGGSSNAAAALKTFNQWWGCNRSSAELHDMAATLGSDVPFFLQPPSAICRGRGELITPIPSPVPKAILLLLPGFEMPTPAVFRKFDDMHLGTDLAEVERTLPGADLETGALLATLVNDLEKPAFALSPELGSLRADIEQRLARPVRMSGSGSTLFTLYPSEPEAQLAAQQLEGVHAIACSLG